MTDCGKRKRNQESKLKMVVDTGERREYKLDCESDCKAELELGIRTVPGKQLATCSSRAGGRGRRGWQRQRGRGLREWAMQQLW